MVLALSFVFLIFERDRENAHFKVEFLFRYIEDVQANDGKYSTEINEKIHGEELTVELVPVCNLQCRVVDFE